MELATIDRKYEKVTFSLYTQFQQLMSCFQEQEQEVWLNIY